MSDSKEGSVKSGKSILKTVLGGCVCLVFIGLLIVTLFPPESIPREPQRRGGCINNVRQIVLALHNYHARYNSFPPAYTTDENGKPLHSWRVLLLPDIEQKSLYDQIRLDEPWDSEYNKQFHDQMPSIYCCPSSGYTLSDGFTSYNWVIGPDTISDGSSTTTLNDVTADRSNVIMLVEVVYPASWMAPVDIDERILSDLPDGIKLSRKLSGVIGVGSGHPGLIVTGYMDGSVRIMNNDEVHELKDKVKIKR